MTGLERKDNIIKLKVPELEPEPEQELLPEIKDATSSNMDEILQELTSTQRKLHEENDDLAELRRRVEMTENNMYLHMHSVGTIRHCLEGNKAKDNRAHEMIRELQKSEKKLYTRKDMPKIRAEVDNELGIKPKQKAKVTGTISLMPIKKCPATRFGIMNSLINITGRMTEFSNIIGKTIKTPLGSINKHHY